MAPPTIAGRLAGRDNNFKLLRIIAASLVILGHSYSVTGGPHVLAPPAPWLPISFGGLAVNVFFTLSGFLIAKSFMDRGHAGAFIRARVLRIYPAAVVAILFTVFVVGWSYTTLPSEEYVTSPDVASYLQRNLPLIFSPVRATLPGVFATNPTPYGVNDPLWTLPYEMWMYGIILGVGLIGLLGRRMWFNIASVMLVAAYWIAVARASPWLDGPAIGPFWRLAFFFLAGSAAYVNRDHVRLSWWAVAVGVGACVLSHDRPWFMNLVDVVLAYATLVAAFVPGGAIRRYNVMGDYSYGLYVFGFPVQQSLAASLPGIGAGALFGLSMVIGLVLAFLSWTFIEAPALRFKSA